MSKSTKTNTVTDNTTHQVTTPTNPAWVDSGLANFGQKITDLSNADPYSLIAGPDALQTQAATGAAGLSSPQGFADAQAKLAGVAPIKSQSLLDGLSDYMNPYTNDVVNTTLKGYDQGAGYSRAGDTLARAGDSTFGGSGGAIQTALNEQNILQGRTATEAQLRDQAFNTGAGLSNQDAQRRQDAASTTGAQQIAAGSAMGGIAGAQGADARANIGLQGDLGSILQQLAQAKAGAPVSLLGTTSNLFNGLNLGLLHGASQDGTSHGTSDSTKTVSDPLGSLGSAAMTGAALFGAPFTGGASVGLLGSLLGGAAGVGSAGLGAAGGLSGYGAIVSDRRLKNYVRKVGELASGLGVFAYRYIWSPAEHVGVMAQDVLKVKPEAVIHLPSGYMAVDYGML